MPDLVTAAEVADAWPAFGSVPSYQQPGLIRDASAIIAAAVGVDFVPTSYVERIDGRNLPRIWLAHRPVLSVSSVAVSGEVLAPADYTLDPGAGELLRGDGSYEPRFAQMWPSGRRNIEVSYQAGYATVPDDVKRACILTIRYHAGIVAVSGAFKSESIGDYSYTIADGGSSGGSRDNLPSDAAAILARYGLKGYDPIY